MTSANLNGTAVTYTYDADGLRTTKQVGSTLYEYEYVGGQLVYEKRGDIRFYYRYDALGQLASIKRINAAGTTYTVYAVTNSRGDIEELRHLNGSLIARYTYDTWGNTLSIVDASGNEITSSTALPVQNPFRYRGYYYDSESGLYYLQSRYYDPKVGRFLNSDSLLDTRNILGYNLFVYCGNNPANLADPTGRASVLAGTLVGATTTAAVYALMATAIVMIVLSVANVDVSFNQVFSEAIDATAEQTKIKASQIKLYAKILTTAVTISQTENKLNDIASKYGNYQCVEAVKEMTKYLLKKKINAKIVHLKYYGSRGYIICNSTGQIISENGNHYGIYYNGKVFCNIHPYGLEESQWKNDFDCLGTRAYHYHTLNWDWLC